VCEYYAYINNFPFEESRLAATVTQQEQILIALRRITRAIDLRSRSLLQDFGLTVPQLTAVQAVHRLQPVSTGAVATEIHLGRATVTGILDRLERQGLIRRARGQRDRRSVEITLTEEGEEVVHNALPLLRDQFRQRLAQLPDWETTQILATLQRIAEMMDAGKIEVAPVLGNRLVEATVAHDASLPDQ
jgi:DNA-binding MarR family transcriptional regulator